MQRNSRVTSVSPGQKSTTTYATGSVAISPEEFRKKFGSPNSTAAKPIKQYTGTEMLGIATMHKSNAVPVFSADTAKSISRMK